MTRRSAVATGFRHLGIRRMRMQTIRMTKKNFQLKQQQQRRNGRYSGCSAAERGGPHIQRRQDGDGRYPFLILRPTTIVRGPLLQSKRNPCRWSNNNDKVTRSTDVTQKLCKNIQRRGALLVTSINKKHLQSRHRDLSLIGMTGDQVCLHFSSVYQQISAEQQRQWVDQ